MSLRNIETVISTLNSLANLSSTMGGQPSLSEQAVAEYLRYGVCILAASGEEGPSRTQAVHIGRLLGRVRNQLGPLLPGRESARLAELVTAVTSKEAREPDLCHRVLDRLEVLRDVHKLPHGYYLPTPIRLVELRSGNALVDRGPAYTRSTEIPWGQARYGGHGEVRAQGRLVPSAAG